MIEDRFVVCIGEGKFAVIAGRRLNDKPLSRVEADRLAKSPVSAAPPSAPEPASPPEPPPTQPAPAVDLRAEPWTSRGGSAGFRIKGSPSW
jgi:hypothetical protein